jgi:hypothetical protein
MRDDGGLLLVFGDDALDRFAQIVTGERSMP